MLKKILIKCKVIPVPVPVRSVQQAIEWAESIFAKQGQLLTKLNLNGVDLIDSNSDFHNIMLNDRSRLELEFDDPKELAIQSLESLICFCRGILSDIKEMAVNCWQLEKKANCEKLDKLLTDLFLVKDLSDHMMNLVELRDVDLAPVQALTGLIFRVTKDLKLAINSHDWKKCSSILLNRLEYLLKEMAVESENLQLYIATSNIQSKYSTDYWGKV